MSFHVMGRGMGAYPILNTRFKSIRESERNICRDASSEPDYYPVLIELLRMVFNCQVQVEIRLG
jgi:hypothetical protein